MSNPSLELPEIVDVERAFCSTLRDAGELFGEHRSELEEELEKARQALREKDEQIKALEEALRAKEAQLLLANKEHEKTKRKLRERDMKLKFTQDHLHDVVHDVEARMICYKESRIKNPAP